MRKLTIGLMTAVLTLSVCGTSVLAAGDGRKCDFAKTACTFVDEDKDGFCDNADEQLCRDNFVDADGDGACDFAGAKDGGICYNNCKTDSKANCTITDDDTSDTHPRQCRPQNSRSRSRGHGRGHNGNNHHGSRRCR